MFIFWCITIVYVERILHCTRHVEKNKIGALKVQITNVLMKIMRNGGRDASIGVVEQKRVKMVEE
mgnify:CR=1 FL=1